MRTSVIAVSAIVLTVLGGTAQVASADPSVTVCHDISITVNDQNVSDAACNTLPPQ